MPEKTARKSSMDPAQEKLRQHKATWNKEISSFINDVIHFKKMMNGWPSKYYKERSRITMPLPVDVPGVLQQMTNTFQQLAQEGSAISQEQAQYSKTRRVPRKQQATETLNKLDQTQGPTTAPVAPPIGEGSQPTQRDADLAKQLSAFEQKYGDGLVAEGSNKLTRTVTRLLNVPGKLPYWTSGAKKRRHRMNMLKRAAQVYKLLGKLQVKIVAPFSNKQSIKDSYELIRGIKTQWGLVGESLELYAKVVGPELSEKETKEQIAEDKKAKRLADKARQPDKGVERAEQVMEQAKEEKADQGGQASPEASLAPAPEEAQQPAPSAAPEAQAPAQPFIGDLEVKSFADKYSKDFSSVVGSKIYDINSFSNLAKAVQNYLQTPQRVKKPDLGRVVMNEYAALLGALNAQYGTTATSLKGIETQLAEKKQSEWEAKQKAAPPGVNFPKPSNDASDQLEVVAQAMLRKWIGRMRHEAIPNDTSDYRINIFDKAKELREEVDKFMNLAESRKTLLPNYEEQFTKINKEISQLESHMMKLYRLYYRLPKDLTEQLGL